MSDETRFIDLETKIAHQEFQLEELSQVMYRQQQQIDQLEKRLQELKQRLESTGQAPEIGPANEKPPHY